MESSEEQQRSGQSIDMALPCSVWGLVSLLVLLEGAVGVEEWFDSGTHKSDPALPAQTLEVLNPCLPAAMHFCGDRYSPHAPCLLT